MGSQHSLFIFKGTQLYANIPIASLSYSLYMPN